MAFFVTWLLPNLKAAMVDEGNHLKSLAILEKETEMKKEDLTNLGIADDVADKIFALHGQGIEAYKTQVTTLTGERDTLKTQLTDAGNTIESFKAMKPDELKAAADEYKTKYEQANIDHANKLVEIDFDKDFDKAISGAKVKYPNEVRSRLKLDELRDNNGKFIAERFNDQITKIKSESIDLFESDKPQPRFTTGANNQPTNNMSAFEVAARKGGNFKMEPEQGK